MAAQRRSNFFQFLLIFVVVYFGSQFVLRTFFPQQFTDTQRPAGIELHMADSSITEGAFPTIMIENVPVSTESFGITGWIKSQWCSAQHWFSDASEEDSRACKRLAAIYTGDAYVLPSRCPVPPVDVFMLKDGQPVPRSGSGTVAACHEETVTVQPGETATVDLAPWKYSFFGELGTYELRLPDATVTGSGTIAATQKTQFTLSEPGIITKIFRTFVTAPFFNALIFIAALMPGYNLGLAIIILTLIVKLVLFIPSKHAMESQKKMQMLQPKIEALKQRHPGDPKKVQEETMKLWAEHKINPMQSCLPTLIQIPILFGLFYVIQDSAHLESARHLIYPFYQDLNWSFGTNFLGLDLLLPSPWIMPPLLVVLQFLQMKLAFAIQKRKQTKKDGIIDIGEKTEEKKPASAQDMQQKIMLYVLPLVIGFLAIQFPAAVSLYWGVSTLFAIGQQVLVNREHLRV